LFRIATALALALSGAAFAYRLQSGPGHGLLNAEGAVALAFVAFLLASSTRERSPIAASPSRWALLLALLLSPLLYLKTAGTPFLYDDYTHITEASAGSAYSVASAFGPVERKPGLFFRPTGFLIYWLNYLWAGDHPLRWHWISILFHLLNCSLFYLLCRRLQLAAGAVVLFAAAAGSVEAVVWIDARFDLLAGLFSLLTLLCVCRYEEDARKRWVVAAIAAAAAGVTTKEAVYCIPVLAASLAFFLPDRRRVLVAALWIGAAVTALFAYRWWALGGLGGYPAGPIDPARLLNALVLREWALLFFPVNWPVRPGIVLRFTLAMTPFLWQLYLWHCMPQRKRVLGAIVMISGAAIPVAHLLMIGPDLSGARILYVPTIGWAVLWGVVLQEIPKTSYRLLGLAWMLILEILMQQHNLRPWMSLPWQSQRVCADFARDNQGRQDRLGVHGLPRTVDGVVMLANGFPECVRMNSPVPNPPLRITAGGEPADDDFDWNPNTRRIDRRRLRVP
jgi:hypothetical protein